jgi:ubiquinone/menaquinone biosynthesis C-methylase UbiE
MEELSMNEIMDKIRPIVIGNNVLDIGTGFGIVIKALINKKEIRITSIDPETWRFDELKHTFLTEIYENRLKLMNAYAENLPFRDNEFTSTISLFSAHHFKDVVKAMDEINRVTSGIVVIADWGPESAGKTNPHTPEQLQAPMTEVENYAIKNNYIVKDCNSWYMAYKKN